MSNDVIQVVLVTPGGVATKSFVDGSCTMRVCLGHIQHPDDGLIAEMQRAKEPIPWESRTARDEALWAVETRNDLDEDTRADLLEWIAATPYFEDA